MSSRHFRKIRIPITVSYILLLLWVIFTENAYVKGDEEFLLGRSVLDLDKKNTCEYYGEQDDIFSDSFHSRICIVPEDGLHGNRDHNHNPRKAFVTSIPSNKGVFSNKLKRKEDHLSSVITEMSGESMRDKRKNVDLETMFGIGKNNYRLTNNETIQSSNLTSYARTQLVNSTNNYALFKQGLMEYQNKKILKYYLYDVSNKKYSDRIVYPEDVLSPNSALNYLGNYLQVYEITKVSNPTVVSWPNNHIVFVNSQVNADGSFKFVVYTSSGQIGFFFEIASGSYKTGCGSYSRIDKTNFAHSANALIQVQLIRRKFGFNVFIDGARRTELDIIDCIASPPTKVEVTSGNGSKIFPKVEDCKVSQWTDWSNCSKTCSTGSKTRYRSVIMPSMNGGLLCPNLLDSTSCNADISCSPCQYSDWVAWSECSVTCGSGTSVRTRKLITANYFAESCIETFQLKNCKGVSCATDCILTEWSDWNDCSTTCGVGNQISTRSIVQPEENGGSCDHELSRIQECNISVCKKSCDPSPCLNGGVCSELPMSNFVCICPPFYGGETCDSFEFPWWFYYVLIVLIVLVIGIIYKTQFSNIITPNTMDPSYIGGGDYAFSEGPAPPPPTTQPQYYQNMNNNYYYGYYGNADESYLVNNDEGNWMY
ncbi:TSP1 domain-containing protein [Cryptosporidium ubiquitum]|uniref:TSP1 domain-containing protein n=1 Tax=Cryptosporidium ubiquitum TaxID=857276 RepID=A0A1J4MMJ2_9CRYT|nr:TSP1 domain-containing protein [Cryptosporidium ubiquitum]OII75474.1 TSP1 domain-containing protein [Cryptosporidium ubiquitum]